MWGKVVAEVTRIGPSFNIRLLYGENCETIRFASFQDQAFAVYLLHKAYLFEAKNGVVLYDCKKEANVTKVDPKKDNDVGIEGGEAMSSFDAIAFLNTIAYGMDNLDIRGTLIVSIPDLDLQVKFESGWENAIAPYFN